MKMPKLNLIDANLKIKSVNGDLQVFGQVRKKYFKLTEEEWVRQNFIYFLNKEKNYPIGLMGVEKMVKYNGLQTRADIILYNSEGNPQIIVECKSSKVKISQETFYQIARYNYKLRVDFLIVTNGLKHYCCKMDYLNQKISFLKTIPNF